MAWVYTWKCRTYTYYLRRRWRVRIKRVQIGVFKDQLKGSPAELADLEAYIYRSAKWVLRESEKGGNRRSGLTTCI